MHAQQRPSFAAKPVSPPELPAPRTIVGMSIVMHQLVEELSATRAQRDEFASELRSREEELEAQAGAHGDAVRAMQEELRDATRKTELMSERRLEDAVAADARERSAANALEAEAEAAKVLRLYSHVPPNDQRALMPDFALELQATSGAIELASARAKHEAAASSRTQRIVGSRPQLSRAFVATRMAGSCSSGPAAITACTRSF